MSDAVVEQLTEAQLLAKAKLDSAVQELSKAAMGTSVMLSLPMTLLTSQMDVVVDLLCEAKLISREEMWTRATAKVDAMAKECRRAVLMAGGASALAGLKKPAGH